MSCMSHTFHINFLCVTQVKGEQVDTNSNNFQSSIDRSMSLFKIVDPMSSLHEFETRIEDSVKNITESSKDSTTLNDSYGNSLLSIGNDEKTSKFSDYTFTNDTLNWPLWLALYNENWIFRRLIDKPAQDEVRCGITLLNNDKEEATQRLFKCYSDNLIQLFSWGALFGGSIAVILIDGFSDKDYLQPFNVNKKKISQAKNIRLYVTDRWYGVAPDYNNIVTKMSDPDYGKPKFYNITMTDGKTFRYRHDYIIRYEHRFAPPFVKMGMLQGWGYSEGAHVFNELARDDKLKSSIQSLVDKSLIEVIKMSGMRGVFLGADKDNETQLRKRLEMVNWGRNYNSLTFLDKDDEYEQNTFSGLAGLADLLQQNMWTIAAAVEMSGILFGDMKQGFSNDPEALERYGETILGRCESYVRPVYEKLLKFIYTMLNIDAKVEFTFNSLLAKKHQEDRLSSISSYITLLSTLRSDGAIDIEQYLKSLKSYVDKNIIDFNITDESIARAKQQEVEQSENFDIGQDMGKGLSNDTSNNDINFNEF